MKRKTQNSSSENHLIHEQIGSSSSEVVLKQKQWAQGNQTSESITTPKSSTIQNEDEDHESDYSEIEDFANGILETSNDHGNKDVKDETVQENKLRLAPLIPITLPSPPSQCHKKISNLQ